MTATNRTSTLTKATPTSRPPNYLENRLAVLQTVVDSSTAEAIAKEQASDDISRIASEIQTEANIETLIKSKGFEKCVAVISDGTASVIVESDGLLPNELSQIKEIVWEQVGIDPSTSRLSRKNLSEMRLGLSCTNTAARFLQFSAGILTKSRFGDIINR